MTRVCVFGAGAIGGFLGARLALAGEDVTCIARGPNLAAIRANVFFTTRYFPFAARIFWRSSVSCSTVMP